MNQKNAKNCVMHMKHLPEEKSDFIERIGTCEETDKHTLASNRVPNNGSNQVTYTRKKGQPSTGNQYLLGHFQGYLYQHFLSSGTTVIAKWHACNDQLNVKGHFYMQDKMTLQQNNTATHSSTENLMFLKWAVKCLNALLIFNM
jgi:hypothetical protein